MLSKHKPRVIAFYLPQFHPIPENDEWWGKGFTEWTNVAKAKPLFDGHYQPHLPADLGFYDLRLPEVRQAQADLAASHGIEGFCYWHYWFGNGRRILERVFEEVLASGKPDFPFCLAWANQSWSGVWHGLGDDILVKQEYPGRDDYIAHFNFLLKAFQDPRYIRVNGKPVFIVYRGDELPDARETCQFWRQLAHERGLPGLHLIGILGNDKNPADFGYNASIPCEPGLFRGLGRLKNPNAGLSWMFRAKRKLRWWLGRNTDHPARPVPERFSYRECAERFLQLPGCAPTTIPCVVPNWDNTPRSGARGFLFDDAEPELYRLVLRKALQDVEERPFEERLVFIKSWNEWAEGNYLEPDDRFGYAYLKVTSEEVTRQHGNRSSQAALVSAS